MTGHPWCRLRRGQPADQAVQGGSKVTGPQKGVTEDRVPVVDGWLEAFATAVTVRTSLLQGAGAAGGLGYALLALGPPPGCRALAW